MAQSDWKLATIFTPKQNSRGYYTPWSRHTHTYRSWLLCKPVIPLGLNERCQQVGWQRPTEDRSSHHLISASLSPLIICCTRCRPPHSVTELEHRQINDNHKRRQNTYLCRTCTVWKCPWTVSPPFIPNQRSPGGGEEENLFSAQHSVCTSITSDSRRDEVTCHAFTNEKHVFSLMHTLATSCQIDLTAFGLPVEINAAPTRQRQYTAYRRRGNSLHGLTLHRLCRYLYVCCWHRWLCNNEPFWNNILCKLTPF